jgi:hypothetical protein
METGGVLTSRVIDTTRPSLKAQVLAGRVKFLSGHDGHRKYYLDTHNVGERATEVVYSEGPGFGVLQVALHEHVLVEASEDNITLDAGVGTRHAFSATTKRRMNQTAKEFGFGYHVWQDGGRWRVTWRSLTREFPTHGVVRLEV